MLGVISCLMLKEFTQVHCNSAFSNFRLVTTLCFCTAAVNEPYKALWLLYVPSALTLKSSVSSTDCIYMFCVILRISSGYLSKQLRVVNLGK